MGSSLWNCRHGERAWEARRLRISLKKIKISTGDPGEPPCSACRVGMANSCFFVTNAFCGCARNVVALKICLNVLGTKSQKCFRKAWSINVKPLNSKYRLQSKQPCRSITMETCYLPEVAVSWFPMQQSEPKECSSNNSTFSAYQKSCLQHILRTRVWNGTTV